MNKLAVIALSGLVLAGLPAGLTLAQQSGQPDGKGPPADARGPIGGPMGGMRGWHRQPPSPEMLQRMLDGRLAGAKAALRLSADQEKYWPAIENVIRENAAERIAFMQKMRAEHGQRDEQMDVLKGLDTASERMTTRATQIKKLADALRPLYATLSDDQKTVLRHEIRQAMGGMMREGMRHHWHQRG